MACLSPRSFWVKVGLGISLGLILVLGHVSFVAPAFYLILFTGYLFWLFYNTKPSRLRTCIGILSFVLGGALMKHWVPGIHNWCFQSDILLSPLSVPWNFWINFDKPLIGIFILMTAPHLPFSWKEGKRIRHVIGTTLLGCVLVLLGISWTIGFIAWDPKIPDLLPLWVCNNLLSVTLAEEAFFRLFVQQSLIQLSQRYGLSWVWGWGLASFLFALFHLPAPPLYIGLCGIAGLFYGFAFQKTGRIEASIAVHFLLNLIHFLFFTYPFSH